MSAARVPIFQTANTTPEGVYPGNPTPNELVENLLDELDERLDELTDRGYLYSDALFAAATWVIARRSRPYGNLDLSYLPKVLELHQRRGE